MSKYFAPSEFRACTPSCSIEQMDPRFLAQLDQVREVAGIPMVLNSAYRSPEWELKHGRAGSSAHCQGRAVDVRCNSYRNRFRIVRAALACGIRRIGIGKSYVHLDASTTHQQDVIWDYYES